MPLKEFKAKSNSKKQVSSRKKSKKIVKSDVDFDSLFVEPPANADDNIETGHDDSSSPYSAVVVEDDEASFQPPLFALTMAEAARVVSVERFRQNIGSDLNFVSFFVELIVRDPSDDIARIIGQFLFNQVVDGIDNSGRHGIMKYWNDLRFHVDFMTLFTFLGHNWLHGSSILSAISKLARPASGIQLLHLDSFSSIGEVVAGRMSFENLNFIVIRPTTTVVVVLLHLRSHWFTITITRDSNSLVAIVYNSLGSYGHDVLQAYLVVYERALRQHSQYFRMSDPLDPVRIGSSVQQEDQSSCGVYVIANVIDLLEGRQSIQERPSPRQLRILYATAAASHR